MTWVITAGFRWRTSAYLPTAEIRPSADLHYSTAIILGLHWIGPYGHLLYATFKMERNLSNTHKLSHIPRQILTTWASYKNRDNMHNICKLGWNEKRLLSEDLEGKDSMGGRNADWTTLYMTPRRPGQEVLRTDILKRIPVTGRHYKAVSMWTAVKGLQLSFSKSN